MLGSQRPFGKADVTLDDLTDHICQLAGDARHAGIGGDTDGQSGRTGAPAEIDTVVDYGGLADVLARRGYGDDQVTDVMYCNWVRFFCSSCSTLPAEPAGRTAWLACSGTTKKDGARCLLEVDLALLADHVSEEQSWTNTSSRWYPVSISEAYVSQAMAQTGQVGGPPGRVLRG